MFAALGIAAIGAVTLGAIAIASRLTVAATASARARLQIAAPIAPATVALAGPDDPPTGSLGDRGFALASADQTIVPRADFGAGTSVVAKTTRMPMGESTLPSVTAVDVVRDRGWPSDRPSDPPSAPSATAALALPSKRPMEDEDKILLPRARPKLAYARPDLDVFPATPGPLPITPGPARSARDARTAVYDIESHTVFLPGGRRLEAHSGLGDFMDNPRFVSRKNRGATPPNTYDLKLRESLFHGVQAIRMNPVDESSMFGRDGILAHSYMLGPNGQSNGCISFKNYPEFLRAFLRGEVDRIVVVPRAGAERFAQLHGRPAGKYAFDGR